MRDGKGPRPAPGTALSAKDPIVDPLALGRLSNGGRGTGMDRPLQ